MLFPHEFFLYQPVKVNGLFSDKCDVTSGVKKRFIIGPVLFLIYNDFTESYVKYIIIKLYGDDFISNIGYSKFPLLSLKYIPWTQIYTTFAVILPMVP